jgi:hypothetical protein
MASKEQVEAMGAVLRETRCACGRAKKLREAFCAKCDRALGADDIRMERYKLGGLISVVMTDAYIACAAWLYAQGYCTREVKL